MDRAAGVMPSLRLEPSVESQSPWLARRSGLHKPQLPSIGDLTDFPGWWAKPASQRPREEQIQQSMAVARMNFHKHCLMERVEERTGEDDGPVDTGPGWEVWLLSRERTSAPHLSTTWTLSQGLDVEAYPVVKPAFPSSPSPSCSGKEKLNSVEIRFDENV